MIDDVVTTLAMIGRAGAFAARRSVAADSLRLEVRGVGPIKLPVAKSQARKLCAIARPARYGLRDQTVLDTNVRDTWEIPRSRIKIDQRLWKRTLLPELDRIRRTLGLADGCELRTELHNLLVYGPGQFFAAHQDTEKTDGMVGSLVVTLPSDFKGGAMVVEHHDERAVSRGSATKLSLVAFYADCHHAVRPIREGYRVALTYNLILAGDASVPMPKGPVDALARQVRAFFETPEPPRRAGDAPRPPPDRLIYLLDHQYTGKGLAWTRLKNADAARAAALRETAERLDCEIFLALADVHELWSCDDEREDFGYGSSRYRYSDYEYSSDDDDEDAEEEDEAEDAADDADHPELVDLEDYDVELRHFVGTGEKLPAASSRVSGRELCYTKPSVEFEPFRFEHEPYMGNWGNTVDRWYHRAAVVMWPRDRKFVIRAKTSASWAVGEMARTLEGGATDAAQRMAEQVQPFWARRARAEQSPRLLQTTLRLAAGLDQPALAASLLEPFEIEQLSPKAAPQLVVLLERYGLEWCRSIIANWASGQGEPNRAKWLPSLPDLVRPLSERGGADGTELGCWLIAEQWDWLKEKMHRTVKYAAPSRLLEQLAHLHRPMLALLESAQLVGDSDLHAKMVDTLTSPEMRGPILNLARLLREAQTTRPRQALRALALGALVEQCFDDLTVLLAGPPRADDDWSIRVTADCTCELCRTLRGFLDAPRQTRLEWPLAEDKRAHVHGVIDSRELPVNHTTRRSGRPYTLVLEKTRALFRQEANERKAWQKELTWLQGKRGMFA